MIVREATASDEPRVRQLFAQGDEKFKNAPAIFRAHDVNFMLEALRAGRVLVAEKDGSVRGMVMYVAGPPPYAMLAGLVVDEAARGNGAGAKLVQAAHTLAGARGATRALLMIFNGAQVQGFYEGQGYHQIGQILEAPL